MKGKNPLSRLEIRLLGGFEVSAGARPVAGFESQKVRALLAYLAMHRDKAQSRDRLAGLLWPEKSDDAARRNLRQAVYNLRNALDNEDASPAPVTATHQSVQFNPEADWWLDVATFEEAVRRGTSAPEGVDPHHLAGASDLYRGDFMAGFYVKDSPEFEHWLLYEQERLREMAIQALRRLVDYYLASRVYHLGVRYARRLLEIDPLFEEAHRNLMRLYALSGRRSHALAQYDECRELLTDELGVEPLEETTALYKAILAEDWPASTSSGAEEVDGLPYLPIVGRDRTMARLERNLETAYESRTWLTFVEGEAGIGKTRLVEEFIGRVTGQTDAVVLRGRCHELSARIAYQPLVEALRLAIAQRSQFVRRALAKMSPQALAEVAHIVPELRALQPGLPDLAPSENAKGQRTLFKAVADFLESLVNSVDSGQAPCPLILFLDDLHWADRPTLDLLQYLVRQPIQGPVWIVGAYRPGELETDHHLVSLRQQLSRDREVDRVALDRLSDSAIQQIALTLVEDDAADALGEFLDRESAGLPLTVVELINYLCEEGILVPQGLGRWGLVGHLPAFAMPAPENLPDLILWRVSQLPTSARRLLTLASVIGSRFDAALLQQIEGEHIAVVEAGIDTWLKRRLVKPVLQNGMPRTEEDVEPSGPSARWGTFEFAHDGIRFAIYYDVSPVRRQVMHSQIAKALDKRYADDTDRVCEALAHHYLAARMWHNALDALLHAGRKARRTGADEIALQYYDQALEVLNRLEIAADDEVTREKWLEQRFDVLALRADVYDGQEKQDQHQADVQRMKDIARQLDDPDHLALVLHRLAPEFAHS